MTTPLRRNLWAGVSAFLGACAFSALLGWPADTAVRLALPLIAALAAALGARFLSRTDRRGQVCFGLVGALLVLAMALGYRLDAVGLTGWDGLFWSLMAALGWGPAAAEAMWWTAGRLQACAPGREAPLGKLFWLSFAVIFLCWLPVELAYYPGCFAYDVDGQMSQLLYNAYTMHHPLCHTLLLGAFYTQGGTVGVFAFVLLQMTALALALSYAVTHLARIRAPRWLRLIVLALFALAPQHAVMSIGTTKDVPFAIAMTVAVVDVHRLFGEPARLRQWRPMLKLAVTLTIACLMRNNVAYALILFALAALFLIGRGNRRRLMALVAAAILLSTGVNKGLQAVTNAEDSTIIEMLSIPAQQLSRVYMEHGLEVETGYEILEWVPNAGLYRSFRSDFTKLHLKVEREGELVGFLKFWVREFFHFPIEYIDAFLYNYKGYWFPDDTTFANIYFPTSQPRMGALVTEQYKEYGIEYQSFLPGLKRLYDSLYSDNHYMRVPGLSALIHPATYVWMLLWALAWAVWQKRWDALAAGLLLAAYQLTLFLGPCVLVRYCYYLMVGAPALVGLLCAKKQ